MATAGIALARLYGAREDLLLAGAIMHDIGKLQELAYDNGAISYTRDGNLVGHIALGLVMVRETAKGISGFPDDLRAELEHLVVSHHGSRDRGLAGGTEERRGVHPRGRRRSRRPAAPGASGAGGERDRTRRSRRGTNGSDASSIAGPPASGSARRPPPRLFGGAAAAVGLRAQREGHRAADDDARADPRATVEHTHAVAEPFDAGLDFEHVAG